MGFGLVLLFFWKLELLIVDNDLNIIDVNVELERVVVERFVEELKCLFEEIVKCIEKI